jgi:uncharacterized Zn finger protein
MKEDIKEILMGIIYTPDGKPNPLFLGGEINPKLDRIDEAVMDIIRATNNPQNKKYCYWSVQDAEHMFNQMKHDEDKFPDVEYTDELGEAIMDLVERRFDAEYGVAWHNIESAIDEIMEDYES